MIDVNLIEKFYSKIFSVPKKRVSISVGFLSIILATYLNGVSGLFFRYLLLGASLVALLLIAGKTLNSGFNSRRIFFFALFLLILIELMDFIVIHLFDREIILLSPTVTAFILSVTLYFTSERFNILIPFLIILSLYPLNGTMNGLEIYVVSATAGISLSYIFIRFLDRNIGRINIAEIVRSFVLYWLKGNPEIFEKELLKFSEVKKGRVYLIKMNDVKIFAPEFHPGPFRDVGGSKLVEESLKKYDMFLHAVSDHTSNPATKEDVRKIVNQIFDLVEAKPKKPFCVEGDKFKLKVYPFDKFNLLIIHGKDAIDDLPSKIREIAEKYFHNPIVVDAHNAYKENYEISASDILEINSLFEKASKIETDFCSLKIYFEKADYLSETVCGKISLLLMKFDGEKHGILMIDSNNMDVELRNKLEKISSINLDIVTTDNHSKTGVSPKIGYKPAGKKDFEFISSFLKKSLENAKFDEAKVFFGFRDVSVKVMGDVFFKEAEEALRRFGECSLYLFFLFSLLNGIISLALGIAFI